jgi:hypothetical protein
MCLEICVHDRAKNNFIYYYNITYTVEFEIQSRAKHSYCNVFDTSALLPPRLGWNCVTCGTAWACYCLLVWAGLQSC